MFTLTLTLTLTLTRCAARGRTRSARSGGDDHSARAAQAATATADQAAPPPAGAALGACVLSRICIVLTFFTFYDIIALLRGGVRCDVRVHLSIYVIVKLKAWALALLNCLGTWSSPP